MGWGAVISPSDASRCCSGFTTNFAWPTQAGATYKVLVHGFSSATGDFDLAILDDGMPATGANDCDGVPEEFDFCQGTVVAESVPTSGSLSSNNSALTDSSGVFTTASPNPQGRTFTIEDTAGCSCEQIVEAQHLGKGHLKNGCSPGAMQNWLDFLEDQSCGNCVEAHGGIGCDVQDCEASICTIDPYCCNVAWDGLCVLEALDICVPDSCIALPSGPAFSALETAHAFLSGPEAVSKDNYTPKE